MRLIFKVISAFCLIISLSVFSLGVFGFYTLPDQISIGAESAEKNNVIYKVQSVSSDGQARTLSANTDENENAFYSLLGIFPVKKVNITNSERTYVYPSGEAFGLKLYSKGVLVVGIDDILTSDGSVSPAKQAGLQVGDIIEKLDGKSVQSNADVSRFLASSDGETVEMLIDRNGEEKLLSFKPVRSDGGTLKAGMWIRDSFAGIGTMTFYTEKTNMFGGLGHAVTDIDTGQTVKVSDGEAVRANISGCVKGSKEAAGELFGSFTDEKIGDLSVNSDRGVFGQISSTPSEKEKIPVALKQEISTGKAQIISTVDETGPQYFDINIIKLFSSSDRNMKNMIIEVTDERLISKTGGIVQGMSGSPIIQNGRLVGAVTHVFINNPLQGYAIYAQNMLDEAENITANEKAAA
ncbi:MAG: SpoIVB peptidase [Ruminococcaceae bacterium]|nr:SpoIVB peptidase [Oscillospiraceae bacterium]